MPGVAFQMEFDQERLGDRFTQAAIQLGELSPLMANIGAIVEDAARNRIENTNTGPDGVAWPQSMRARLEGGPTLFKTGHLAGWLHHEATRSTVEIGSNLIYAGVHQDGATITAKNGKSLFFALPGNGELVNVQSVTIPARPYLGISDDDKIDIEAAMETFVYKAFGGLQ